MSKKEELVKWIQWGARKRVIAQVLKKPMTTAELYYAAVKLHTKIQPSHVTSTLREFEKRKLVSCLFPHRVRGRLYYFSERGRKVMNQATGITPAPLDSEFDWNVYSKLSSAKVRRVVLMELSKNNARNTDGKTVVEVKKNLQCIHPIGVNHALVTSKDPRGKPRGI